jgi:hypothetical protein
MFILFVISKNLNTKIKTKGYSLTVLNTLIEIQNFAEPATE